MGCFGSGPTCGLGPLGISGRYYPPNSNRLFHLQNSESICSTELYLIKAMVLDDGHTILGVRRTHF